MRTIRKAELRDVPAVFEMISQYATEGIMLPRPLHELYENVREFTIAEEDGTLVGSGALQFYSAELAEIRSLCVKPGLKGHGVGRALAEALLAEATRCGLKTVFALTLSSGFFAKLRFREVPRERFTTKIWRDCLQCPKYFHCQQKAVAFDVSPCPTSPAPPAVEAGKVLV